MMHDFDTVALTVALPPEALTVSELPPEEGLRAGDEGAIVDATHAPAAFTVEFFRDGETVAIADVGPGVLRLVQQHIPQVSPTTRDTSPTTR